MAIPTDDQPQPPVTASEIQRLLATEMSVATAGELAARLRAQVGVEVLRKGAVLPVDGGLPEAFPR